MPSRKVVAVELANFLKVIAHPDRIRLIEILKGQERDVTTIAEVLELPAARVSQHLALLRAHQVVEQKTEGRAHFYRLKDPDLAEWIVDGLDFLEARARPDLSAAIDDARAKWATRGSDTET